MFSTSLERYCFLIFMVVVAIIVLSYGNYLDDAFILFKYAENIAHGNNWVFNPSDAQPYYGTTSALYPILLAIAEFGANLIGIRHITPHAGFFLSYLCICIIGYIGMKLFLDADQKVAAYTFPLLIALCFPQMLTGAISMETFITLALNMSAIYAYRHKHYNSMGIFVGLAVLSRPDAIILPLIIVLHYVYKHRRFPPLTPILLSAAIIIPWLIYAQLTFGRVLPSTLSAKLTQADVGFWGEGSIFFRDFIGFFTVGYGEVTFLALVVCIILLMRNQFYVYQQDFVILIFGWSITTLIAYIILNPPGYHWYFTPYIIAISTVFALSLEIIAQAKPRNLALIKIVFPILASFLLGYHLFTTWEAKPNRFTAYRDTAEWMNANVPEGSSLSANEVGILGYYYDNGPVIDGLGLVTPGVVEQIEQGNLAWFITAYQPDYVTVNDPPWAIIEDFVDEPWFQRQYTLIEVIGNDAKRVRIYERQ